MKKTVILALPLLSIFAILACKSAYAVHSYTCYPPSGVVDPTSWTCGSDPAGGDPAYVHTLDAGDGSSEYQIACDPLAGDEGKDMAYYAVSYTVVCSSHELQINVKSNLSYQLDVANFDEGNDHNFKIYSMSCQSSDPLVGYTPVTIDSGCWDDGGNMIVVDSYF